MISPLQIDFPIIIYPGTRHVNFCWKVCIRVIGSLLCSNSNLPPRDEKYPPGPLNLQFKCLLPTPPSPSNHSYHAINHIRQRFTLQICRATHRFGVGICSSTFCPLRPSCSVHPTGLGDYCGILNIAASKSWISISYIISAALYKYDKRVVYRDRYCRLRYGAKAYDFKS